MIEFNIGDPATLNIKMSKDTVNAAAVRLPQFSPNQLLAWFGRAERHFKLKEITNSITKAAYALEAVPEPVF